MMRIKIIVILAITLSLCIAPEGGGKITQRIYQSRQAKGKTQFLSCEAKERIILITNRTFKSSIQQ